MLVEENRLDAALQEIPTEIERKQARTYRVTVEKVEGQQRKRGCGINGCRNFARKDTSYVCLRFERLHLYGFVYVCTLCHRATKHSIVRVWRPTNTLQTILLGMCMLAILYGNQSSLFVIFEGKHYILHVSSHETKWHSCCCTVFMCSWAGRSLQSCSCTDVLFGRQNEAESLASPCWHITHWETTAMPCAS